MNTAVLSATRLVRASDTLEEKLLGMGLRPIDLGYVRQHKAAEREKAPRATPNYLFWTYSDKIVVGLVASWLATTIGAIVGFLSALWPIGAFLLLVCAGKVAIENEGRRICGPARWRKVRYTDALHLAPWEVTQAVNRIKQQVPEARFSCDKLVQGSFVLDPVWYVHVGRETACIAITDAQGKIVKMA